MTLLLTTKKHLRQTCASALHFLFPQRCQYCRCYLPSYPKRFLCEQCHSQLYDHITVVCMVCGKSADSLELPPYLCGDCRYKDRPDLWFLHAGMYEGILKKLIHKMKYERRQYIAHLLTNYLITFLEQQQFDSQEFDCIIPVPLSAVKYRERGFNQTELIGKQVSQWGNIPLKKSILRRKHHAHAQVELSRSERLNNLRDVFNVRRKIDLSGQSIILIDDVRSTGSTLYFCAQALFEAGAEKILCLTLAFNEG